MEIDIEKLKYPIGKFQNPDCIDDKLLEKWIKIIEEFPQKVKIETENLTDEDFNKKYRPGGWTIRQIVNHCADSHMNSLIRFKLAITEDLPTIKSYSEDLWAELADSKNFPIESSIKILEGLHDRWVVLLKSMSENDLEKAFIHPETQEKVPLKSNIGIYAWHCEHHLTHIIIAKNS